MRKEIERLEDHAYFRAQYMAVARECESGSPGVRRTFQCYPANGYGSRIKDFETVEAAEQRGLPHPDGPMRETRAPLRCQADTVETVTPSNI